jgi:5-hydroxyisourate hydrolase
MKPMASHGISIHVVDATRSRAAVGMKVEVFSLGSQRTLIASGVVGPRGIVDEPRLAARRDPGCYEVAFHVADYFNSTGVNLPVRPFLDVVRYQFGISDAERHYHLPFKTTPWGYSCFLGA